MAGENRNDDEEKVACGEFVSHLREEKLKQQEFRASYVRLKFTFVIGLFSIAATLTTIDSRDGMFYVLGLLYLAPLVAVLFDFYILGGEFAVKRIRTFLNEQDQEEHSEKVWDRYLARCPKAFMQMNRRWVTGFIFAAAFFPLAAYIVNYSAEPHEWGLFTFWIILTSVLQVYLARIEKDIQRVFHDSRVNVSKT